MSKPAARLTDMTLCPMATPGVPPIPHVGGPITGPCSPNVITGGMPQARVTDMAQCVGPPDMILVGSSTVLVNNLPAARIGDQTTHGGVIITGFPMVLIGDQGGAGAGAAGVDGGAQRAALKNAAQSGKPFCEKCHQAALRRQAGG